MVGQNPISFNIQIPSVLDFLSSLYRCGSFERAAASRFLFFYGIMVVFVNLDKDDAFDPFARPKGLHGPLQPALGLIPAGAASAEGAGREHEKERANPNINIFSAALACYP